MGAESHLPEFSLLRTPFRGPSAGDNQGAFASEKQRFESIVLSSMHMSPLRIADDHNKRVWLVSPGAAGRRVVWAGAPRFAGRLAFFNSRHTCQRFVCQPRHVDNH